MEQKRSRNTGVDRVLQASRSELSQKSMALEALLLIDLENQRIPFSPFSSSLLDLRFLLWWLLSFPLLLLFPSLLVGPFCRGG